MDISPQDRDLIVRTTLAEAGDQSPQGQAAVAHVIMNRVASGEWGNTPSQVVLARGQFAPWGQPGNTKAIVNLSPTSKSYQSVASVVDGVLSGQTPDPTGGAKYFLDPQLQQKWIARGIAKGVPGWAQGPGVSIGAHTFYNPDDPNYGSKALSYTAAADPDPLGSWVKSLPKSPSAPAASSSPAEGDDLLGAWAKSVSGPPVPLPLPLPLPRPAAAGPSATPAVAPASPADETLPQYVNRLESERQGNSWADLGVRFGAGVMRGVGDVGDTLAEGIAKTGQAGADVLGRYDVLSPGRVQAVHDWRSGVLSGITSANTGFDAAAGNSDLASTGRLVGNVVGSAPFLAAGEGAAGALTAGSPVAGAIAARPVVSATVRGAGAGAGANLLTSSTSDQPLSDQVLSGAETGAVLGPLGYGAGRLGSRLFGGAVDQETARLAQQARNQYGIPVTAGQISSNPTVRFFDSVMQRLPFTGYGARTAEQQTALNHAVSNTFGEDADRITPQLLQSARQRIGAMFDSVAQRTGNIRVDQQFSNDLRGIVTDAMQVLPDSDLRPLGNQIQNIVSTIDPATGTLDARSYQALTRKGAPLDRALQNSNPNVRYYAGQVRDALDDVMQRSAPADAVQDLIEARSQWKALKTVEPLAEKATTGDISPALIMGAVNKSYSGAGGDLGNLGRIGQRFLKEPPSSGTAERNMILQHLPQLAIGATGLGGLGAAQYFDPESWQRNALLAAGTLAAGRAAGGALRSNLLANTIIRSGLRAGQQSIGQGALPLLLPASGALIQGRGALSSQSP